MPVLFKIEDIYSNVPTGNTLSSSGRIIDTLAHCDLFRDGFFYVPDFWLNTFGQGSQTFFTETARRTAQSQEKRAARASNHT